MSENFTPIKCPVCGSMNLAFTEEIRSSLGRIVNIILTIGFVVFFLLTINVGGNIIENLSSSLRNITIGVIIYLLCYFIVQIIICNTERRSHCKAICRDCGHLWLID